MWPNNPKFLKVCAKVSFSKILNPSFPQSILWWVRKYLDINRNAVLLCVIRWMRLAVVPVHLPFTQWKRRACSCMYKIGGFSQEMVVNYGSVVSHGCSVISASHLQFFMNSALTPFPAQQTFQIISNLPTQDRHLHATLCASGFFSFFLALVAYPKFFTVFATDQGKRTQMCHGEYRLSICVYRCLGLRVLIFAQCTCTGSTTLWFWLDWYPTVSSKQTKKRRSNVLCCCIWKEFLQC